MEENCFGRGIKEPVYTYMCCHLIAGLDNFVNCHLVSEIIPIRIGVEKKKKSIRVQLAKRRNGDSK